MANRYAKGATIRISGMFTVGGAAADPTVVTLRVQDPSGNEETFSYANGEVTRSATGMYCRDVQLDESGTWHYRWEGEGAAACADERQVYVKPSVF